MQITYQLSDDHWEKLKVANELLTEITDRHHPTCECELCKARMLTDTQDAESRAVRCTPAKEGWPGEWPSNS